MTVFEKCDHFFVTRKKMNQINKSMQCQVVVVGDAKVGKSAIIRRITQDKFSEVRSIINSFEAKDFKYTYHIKVRKSQKAI